jgi:peptidyl-prolyl cis-trans isomerase B (cyclophilin B)
MQILFQRLILVSCLFGVLILGGCDTPKQQQQQQQQQATTTTAPSPTPSSSPALIAKSTNQFPGLPRLKGKATVVMTVKGNKQITIVVDGDNAPISAGNFVELVSMKFYDGLTFHRVVKDPDPFVVQGGDPNGNGSGGYIPKGSNTERRIPLEIMPVGGTEPVYSVTLKKSEAFKKGVTLPKLTHKRGTIAMARSSFPDSASSQFYFPLIDSSFLDGDYAVFGKITGGVEVIDTIQQGDKIISARVTQGIENLKK